MTFLNILMDCLSDTWLILLILSVVLTVAWLDKRKRSKKKESDMMKAMKTYQKSDLEYLNNINCFISKSNKKFTG